MDLFPTILDMSHIRPSKAIQGKSLLPIGMTCVDGDFSRGEVIAILGSQGQEVAD